VNPDRILLRVTQTAISPDRKRLAVFNGSDGFFVLDTDKLQLQCTVKSPEDRRPGGDNTGSVQGVAFNPDGEQLAALFQRQQTSATGRAFALATLVRWDLKTNQRVARFIDPTKIGTSAAARLGWWGPNYCWVTDSSGGGRSVLVSWDRSTAVTRTAAPPGNLGFPGTPDGRFWFIAGPVNAPVLKALDAPADGLAAAAQPLQLTAEGLLRK
jgi:hypothetical protein